MFEWRVYHAISSVLEDEDIEAAFAGIGPISDEDEFVPLEAVLASNVRTFLNRNNARPGKELSLKIPVYCVDGDDPPAIYYDYGHGESAISDLEQAIPHGMQFTSWDNGVYCIPMADRIFVVMDCTAPEWEWKVVIDDERWQQYAD